MMLPKLKKRITSFLVGEEGKISKQSLLSLGAFLGTGVLAGILAAKDVSAGHTNTLTVGYSGGEATGTHGHHSSSSTTSDTTGDYGDTTGDTTDDTTSDTTSDTTGGVSEGY